MTRNFLILAALLASCANEDGNALLGDASGPRGPTEISFERVDPELWPLEEFGEPPNLYDVWGTGQDNIWIVGERNTIVHHDGENWTLVDLSNTTTRTEDFWSIYGRDENEMYVVGTNGMVLHYYIPMDQRNNPDAVPQWFEEDSGTSQNLNDVAGSDNGVVLAVGDNGTITGWHPQRMAWQVSTSTATVESLHAVRIRGSEATAVGNLGAIIHYTGNINVWARERIAGLTTPLREIWGRNDGNQYIGGLEGTLLNGSRGGWNAIENIPLVYLRGMDGLGNRNFWIVGWEGIILHIEGNNVTEHFGFTTQRLESIFATRENDPYQMPDDAGNWPQRPAYWAVGVSGTIMKGPFGLSSPYDVDPRRIIDAGAN